MLAKPQTGQGDPDSRSDIAEAILNAEESREGEGFWSQKQEMPLATG